MEIIVNGKETNPEPKTQIQFHGFGEKSKSFTIKGMTAQEAFSRVLKFFEILRDNGDAPLEIKAYKKG